MQRGMTGRFEVATVAGERVEAFVPAPLPPQPAIVMDHGRQRLLENALLACGRLDAITALLPEPDLFLMPTCAGRPCFPARSRDSVFAVRPAALRARKGVGHTPRRRR